MPDDYEGKVVCTLVKKPQLPETKQAILYIHGKGSIEVCKILFQAFAEERILVRQYRASVLAEVHSIKVITVGIHAVTQLFLKKIVIVAMYIQDCLFGLR